MKAPKQKKIKANVWGLTRTPLVVLSSELPTKDKKKRGKILLDAKAEKALLTEEVDSVFKIRLNPKRVTELESDPALRLSLQARFRDLYGQAIQMAEKAEVEILDVELPAKVQERSAAVIGLEIALYRFKRLFKKEQPAMALRLHVSGQLADEKEILRFAHIGLGVNLARHFVNLPPNILHPESYAKFLQDWFRSSKHLRIEIWDKSRLQKEGMNLHLAVGQGSPSDPCLIRISYRPKVAGRSTPLSKPIALVGKGITFDTGGVDIKPSSGMRLMKKDMGGSATVAGVAHWLETSQLDVPVDCYLALAENSVDGRSFRPSDILTARNGLSVEIHNTDAEGRLVLADAMDVAITRPEKPKVLIDVATLTGAIKAGLGAQLPGLFANNERLRSSIQKAAIDAGDLVWPMPLYKKYLNALNSTFADVVNASDGFGGAITAALFLQKFVGDVPWAHLDIYAWRDSAEGAWSESGGSGQAVLALIQWFQQFSTEEVG